MSTKSRFNLQFPTKRYQSEVQWQRSNSQGSRDRTMFWAFFWGGGGIGVENGIMLRYFYYFYIKKMHERLKYNTPES